MIDIVVSSPNALNPSTRDYFIDHFGQPSEQKSYALRFCLSKEPDQALWDQCLKSAQDHRVNLNRVPHELSIKAFKLLAIDMDSTLIENECIDEMAACFGVGPAVKGLTEKAMSEGWDFSESLRERVALLKGAPERVIEETLALVRFTQGARVWMVFCQTHGLLTYIVSGGFRAITEPVRAELEMTGSLANELGITDGHLNGQVSGPQSGPILDANGKRDSIAQIALEHGFSIKEVMAGGDGSNDRALVKAAGLGFAFHGKPILKGSADVCIDFGGLEQLMELFIENWR